MTGASKTTMAERPMTAALQSELIADTCCDTVRVAPLAGDEAARIADALQLLGHPIRLQILGLLGGMDGCESCQICVCDIESALPVKQPTVSHHLKILREAGLIDYEKRGLYAYYFVRRDSLNALWASVASRLARLGARID